MQKLVRRGFMLQSLSCAAFFVALASPGSAQWLKFPNDGIPRTADGKANLTAPAPKLADGTPDFSGIWQQPNGVKYTHDIAADLKPTDVPFQPWAAKVYQERLDNLGKDDPIGHCGLPGVPQMDAIPYPFKFLQNGKQITILYEAFATFRQIFMDGRSLPKDPNPAWMGYSVGKWDGDTLVVNTTGFNDITWLDSGGRPHSDQLRVTERFRREDFGHMNLEILIDDPGAYTKPWKVSYKIGLIPDTELLEYLCTENNKDPQHLVGK